MRILSAALAALGLVMALPGAQAQEWAPARSVKIIVPFAPGGSADILARLLAQQLGENLGQAVVVDNRSGGNTVIATSATVRSPPDGLTLGMLSTPFVVTAAIGKNIPYDAQSDIQPLTLLGRISLVLATNPGVRADVPDDLVKLSKTTPLAMGSGGNGTAGHLADMTFMLRTGGQFTHIPYRGGGPAMNDLLSGQLQFMFNAMGSTLPFIKSGKFRALAISGAKRSPALPDVPTMQELGYADFEFYEWFGLIVPPGTPPEIVNRYSKEVGRFVQTPEMQTRMQEIGMELVHQTPAEFRAYLDGELKRVGEIVRDGGITVE